MGGGVCNNDFDTGWVKLINHTAYKTGSYLLSNKFQLTNSNDYILARSINSKTYIKGIMTSSDNTNDEIYKTNIYINPLIPGSLTVSKLFSYLLVPDEISFNEEFNTNLDNVKLKFKMITNDDYGTEIYAVWNGIISANTRLKFDIEFFYNKKNMDSNKQSSVFNYLNFKYNDSLKRSYENLTY